MMKKLLIAVIGLLLSAAPPAAADVSWLGAVDFESLTRVAQNAAALNKTVEGARESRDEDILRAGAAVRKAADEYIAARSGIYDAVSALRRDATPARAEELLRAVRRAETAARRLSALTEFAAIPEIETEVRGAYGDVVVNAFTVNFHPKKEVREKLGEQAAAKLDGDLRAALRGYLDQMGVLRRQLADRYGFMFSAPMLYLSLIVP